MTEEVISNGFTHDNSIEGSNPPPLKKKRNLPGNPGKFIFWISLVKILILSLIATVGLQAIYHDVYSYVFF